MKRDYLNLKKLISISLLFPLCLIGCGTYSYGPDKQGQGFGQGAIGGAVSGAITGFHLGATTGSGALVGAGIGALAGSAKGMLIDQMEEKIVKLEKETNDLKRSALAQSILIDIIERQVKSHPHREIYPADLFFIEGSAKVSSLGKVMLSELGKLIYNRLPWSRIAVASYIKSGSRSSANKDQLTIAEDRAKVVGNALVAQGVEPRRIVVWGQLTDQTPFLDDFDDPFRYNQAIEIIALDNQKILSKVE